MIDLVVFDLDGPLVDSGRDLADATNELIAILGGTALSETAVTEMVGEGAAVLRRSAFSIRVGPRRSGQHLRRSAFVGLAACGCGLLDKESAWVGPEQRAQLAQARCTAITDR